MNSTRLSRNICVIAFHPDRSHFACTTTAVKLAFCKRSTRQGLSHIIDSYEHCECTVLPLVEARQADLQVLNITIPDNPAKFGDPYTFDITFECLEPLSKGTFSHGSLSTTC